MTSPLRVLLVHGMGRSPLSMWRLARALHASGCVTETFGYVAAWQSIDAMVARLQERLTQMADGDYVVIGHSLGAILLRAALASLPAGVRRPRRLIMLGPPNHSPRLARRFEHALWYRAINGDAGKLLADETRLARIAPVDVPSTVIAGTRGLGGRWSPFHGDANDGIVAVSETELSSAAEWITLPVAHPFLPANRRVIALVLERCRAPQ
jgi:pimeloyl-ACP methyl ester carboxylesterase